MEGTRGIAMSWTPGSKSYKYIKIKCLKKESTLVKTPGEFWTQKAELEPGKIYNAAESKIHPGYMHIEFILGCWTMRIWSKIGTDNPLFERVTQ